jgi:hypothetical protein
MSQFRTEYRALSQTEKNLVSDIKDCAYSLDTLLGSVTDSRMKALARTKLEECVMWAVKGVTG